MKSCQYSYSLWDFCLCFFSFYNKYSVQQFTDGWTAWIADHGKAY